MTLGAVSGGGPRLRVRDRVQIRDPQNFASFATRPACRGHPRSCSQGWPSPTGALAPRPLLPEQVGKETPSRSGPYTDQLPPTLCKPRIRAGQRHTCDGPPADEEPAGTSSISLAPAPPLPFRLLRWFNGPSPAAICQPTEQRPGPPAPFRTLSRDPVPSYGHPAGAPGVRPREATQREATPRPAPASTPSPAPRRHWQPMTQRFPAERPTTRPNGQGAA